MIAFFPGKFQPVHLGHVLTLMSIYDDYDFIIVGITDDGPYICSRSCTQKVFTDVFRLLPKVKTALIDGILCDRKSPVGLPSFDILLSGNPAVLKWARKHHVKCVEIPRSEGLGFSGTDIRSVPAYAEKVLTTLER